MVEQFLLSQVLMIHHTKFGQCAKYLSHLVIDAEHVHDVDPDVDGVDEVWEWEVKLVVASGQAEVLAGREGLGTCHLKTQIFVSKNTFNQKEYGCDLLP